MSSRRYFDRVKGGREAYALERHEPTAVIELADHKLQFFEPGAMATVLCAVCSLAD
jgi:hypothetical protein